MPFSRVIWIVLDSVGIGEMPDAAAYGDAGSNTLGNIARLRPLQMPNFAALGLGNIAPVTGVGPVEQPTAAFGKCALASPGKDTTTGHWEMVGIHLDEPLPLYPNGFDAGFMKAFEDRIGRETLGNKAASGTEIIAELGDEHVRTGSPIIYTSADSVFQVAAHEEVIPLWELYKICETAREMLPGIGRIIARPFEGESGAYRRTANRKDYAMAPAPGMLLDRLAAAKVPVHSVGKIFDVFLGRGIQLYDKTKTNADGMAKTLAAMADSKSGLIFVNLVDFDMLFGHRNDVEGYAGSLEECDAWVPSLLGALAPGDLLIFTADHGCDPTTPSTDHSREYTPLLVYGGAPAPLGTRATLADIGQTVAENFGVEIAKGTSFLSSL
jgi:phosphopentomutase